MPDTGTFTMVPVSGSLPSAGAIFYNVGPEWRKAIRKWCLTRKIRSPYMARFQNGHLNGEQYAYH
jgi:hypothetical protein